MRNPALLAAVVLIVIFVILNSQSLVLDVGNRPVGASNGVVVVSASWEYRVVLMNWLVAGVPGLEEGGLGVVVLCLDERLMKWVTALGSECILTRTAGAKELWRARLQEVARQLEVHPMVVLSDLDAIWVRSPTHHLLSIDADVIAQRGSFPKPLFAEWGATVCMGFFAVKATTGGKEVIRTALEVVKATNDDQVAVNTALVRLGLAWDRRLGYENSTHVDYGRGVALGTPLTVALLPHSQYPRVCPDTLPPDVVVAHCYHKGVAKRDALTKTAFARQLGLWFLDDNWRSVPLVTPFYTYIKRLRR